MTHREAVDAVDELVDQAGLAMVLVALSNVCMRRADRLYEQPDGRGKALSWRTVARALDALDEPWLPR